MQKDLAILQFMYDEHEYSYHKKYLITGRRILCMQFCQFK